jgi:hypothetical protein
MALNTATKQINRREVVLTIKEAEVKERPGRIKCKIALRS